MWTLMRVAAGMLILGVATVSLAEESRTADKPEHPYTIVDTGQHHIFSDRAQLRTAPRPGEAFYGQDGYYQGAEPRYRAGGDGTISDLNTGLMWVKNIHGKVTFRDAAAGANACRVGGYRDWRFPTIKELYSLIIFTGNCRNNPPIPYVDKRHFEFEFGNEARGERIIDAQYWSATQYLGLTMGRNRTVFGVNFADGRIKGYPRDRGRGGGPNRQYVRYVRGNPAYGKNRFVAGGDGTVSDLATGLMWANADSPRAMSWQQTLAWCQRLELAGHDDWRLPNAKELQSIVDYDRAPDALDAARRGPAIDPVFRVTDPDGWCWSSTTHYEGGRRIGEAAVYVAFGRATGFFPDRRTGRRTLMDVHGAGAQRSDPKSGDPKWFPQGRGPQGDVVRIYNHARAVRNIDPADVTVVRPDTSKLDQSIAPRGPMGGRHRPPRRGGRRPPPRRRR